jgi:hypothetical protein
MLDYHKQLEMPKRCIPVYSGEVTKANLLTPSGSAMVVKKFGLGSNFTPPPAGHWKVKQEIPIPGPILDKKKLKKTNTNLSLYVDPLWVEPLRSAYDEFWPMRSSPNVMNCV